MFETQQAVSALNKRHIQFTVSKGKRNGVGRSSADRACAPVRGPDIEAVDEVRALILECQCVEELQEEDDVKEQCRCNPTEQERTERTGK